MKKRGVALLLTLALVCTGTVSMISAETTAQTPVTARMETDTETGTKPDTKADTKTDTDTETDTTTEPVRFVLAPSGISKKKGGSLIIADRTHQVVRVRNTSGEYRVLAGTEDLSGYKNGSAKKVLFHTPWDVVSYKSGWLISDSENHVLRQYQDGRVTTVAGTGESGYKNATGRKAQFNRPTGMAVGSNGEVYIADTGNHVIRRIDENGKVTTYAGSKKGCADGTLKTARFYEPTGLFYYKGALYVADSGNHRICRIENGKVTTVAGSAKGIEGDKNGSALKARLSNPQDIMLYKNEMYISDTGNACVKKLSKGKVTTLISAFSMGDGREPAEPCGLMIQGGKLYIGDIFTEELIEFEL